MSSMPRCEAASISITSSDVPLAIVTHGLQTLSGVGVGPLDTVQALGQDPCERGLPGAARAGEEICRAHLPGRDRVFQRPDDCFLADDLVEVLRAVLPVQRGHGAILA